MPSQLSPSQLCQVLNYILGLPVKHRPNGGFVRRERLHPCVAFSWGRKRCLKVELWAEDQMMREGMLPREAETRGRGRAMPRELNAWINPPWFSPVKKSAVALAGSISGKVSAA